MILADLWLVPSLLVCDYSSLLPLKQCEVSEQISSMATSRIVTLAKVVEANTVKLDEYLEKNNLPQPSFDVDAPLMYQLPPDIAAAQENLTAALDELYWLNQGPIQTVVAKTVSTHLNPSPRFDRTMTWSVCCVGRSQDDSSLQNSNARSTRLRCNLSGACG